MKILICKKCKKWWYKDEDVNNCPICGQETKECDSEDVKLAPLAW